MHQALLDGGGGGGRPRSDGPFDYYDAGPEQVRTAGDQITRVGGDVENLAGDVTGTHRVAQYGVAGLLADPLLAAHDRVRGQVDGWLRGAVFSGGAVRLFADGVAAYNRGIDDLNRRYQTAKENRFWVTAPNPEDYPTAGDFGRAYDLLLADAERALLRELEQERHSTLEPALDDQARLVAGFLDRGPDDAGAVQALYQAGALPLAAPAVFTEVDFGDIDPAELFANLVDSGQLPAELATMTEDELFEWFTNHPTEAGLVAVLLPATGTLPERQQRLVRALGRYDAWLVNQGLAMDPSPAGLSLIGQGNQRLAEINGRAAQGEPLTAAERAYLDAWFNGVGADHLAALDGYVVAATDVPAGLPGYAGQAMIDGNRSEYLSPVADAIMNLSDPDRGGVAGLAELPQAIQDLANTPIGELDRAGFRWPSLDEQGNPDYDRTDPMDFTVAGLDRYGGFADLLESATVDGGVDFTRELGESALRVKQDLNAIAANLTEAVRATDNRPGSYDALWLATFDDEVSDMLSVVAANEPAAAAMLIDDDDRRLLLGLNWYDDDGVVDILEAGTRRDPDGGGELPAAATLAVMQEVGGDRDFYLGRMTEDMSDAVVDAGITWIDAFGRPATTGSPSEYGQYEDPLGNRALGIQLSPADRANFLQFVSGTGEDDAMRFRGASVVYSQDLVAQALQSGDSTVVNLALAAAGRMDGAITAADYEYALDQTGAAYDEAAAAHQAEVRRNAGYALGAKVAWTVGSAAINGATGGSMSLFTSVAGTVVVDPLINEVFSAGPPPTDQTPQTRAELFNADRLDQSAERNYFLLSAHQHAGTDLSGEFPDLYQPDGTLRPFDELAGSARSSDLLQDLQQAQNRAEESWQEPPGRGDIDVGQYYDTERNNIANGSYWQDAPNESGWTDPATARQRLYGERYVGDGRIGGLFGGGDIRAEFERRVPADPAQIYGPRR